MPRFILTRKMSNTLRGATLPFLFVVLLERGPAPPLVAANPNIAGLGRLARDLVRREGHDETVRIPNAS